MKNEDINSCVYALIQLSGHSPKTGDFFPSGFVIISERSSAPVVSRWLGPGNGTFFRGG